MSIPQGADRRHVVLSTLLVGVFLVLVPGVVPLSVAQDSASNEPALQEEARIIARQSSDGLKQRLRDAISSRGLAQAFAECRVDRRTESCRASSWECLELQRVAISTGHARMTKEESDAAAVIGQFRESAQSQNVKGLKPVIQASSSRQHIAYVPIAVDHPMCLQCHGRAGKELAPQAVSAMGAKAGRRVLTGYVLGDVIGAWKIKFAR